MYELSGNPLVWLGVLNSDTGWIGTELSGWVLAGIQEVDCFWSTGSLTGVVGALGSEEGECDE